MARATFVKAAQKNIYKTGKRVEYKSEKGKRAGQTLSKTDRTIPADEHDEIFIAKGESYYWWQFLYGSKNYSKTAPRRSQLTQSGFLSQLYALEESIEEFTCENKEDFDSFKEEILSEIDEMKEQRESSLDAMPEQLKQAPTGELLQERIDNLESWHDEIDSIECEDYDEEELKNEIKSEDEEISDEDLKSELQNKIQEIVDTAIEELQGTSLNL